ncbi:type IA DNA topoisomerase [Heliophilum fasciatum]|uniref:DNA topoisomerase n=1 Tax=Heliophilum fasciatum TaxID=35700 RepID=A0A4R2RLX0_9FIRM|nr:type IA DNA topoisomerase [Heliophilum fasciatum]MCW2277603.1 DNA topoisomerase-3 [Heliophilum fasciatum]TCP64952.1 DNA topoisomerase-3 [Heliophilum fasciatum]
MLLVIAEKPSAARDIARVIAPQAHKTPDGFLADANCVIAHARGHLVELVLPPEIDPKYKRWSYEHLPILPERIPLKLRYGAAKEFEALKRLLRDRRFEAVVCATDAGREGQLIFDFIYEHAGGQLPVQRLWLSTFTDDGIRRAWQAMKSHSAYANLSLAARLRSYSDWVVGMNACPAVSLAAKATINVGRVMTPTLKLIVERTRENENFVPRTYFQVVAEFGELYRGTLLDDAGEKLAELEQREAAERVVERITGQMGQVLSYQVKREKRYAKPLYNLGDLQVEAARLLGFTADHTLEVAQKLYQDRKCLSYPRTSSRHLEKAMLPELPKHIRAVAAIPEVSEVAQAILAKPLPSLSKAYVDDTKVTDHHGLIPTEKPATMAGWSEDERRLFLMVVRRFLAIFLPPAEYDKTTIITGVPDQKGDRFRSTGSQLIVPGWQVLYPSASAGGEKNGESGAKNDDDEPDQGALPVVATGATYPVTGSTIEEKQTKPRPLYTDGSLIRAMQNIAAQLDDAALKSILKPLGLGTEATRAATIEKLIKLGMVARTGKGKTKQLVATQFGHQVIDAIADEAIKSPALTALWEDKLAQVEEGQLPEAIYRQELGEYVRRLIDTLRSQAKPVQAAPKRGTGTSAVMTGAEEGATGGSARGRGRSTSGKAGGATKVGATSAGVAKRAARSTELSPTGDAPFGTCPLCGKPIIEGKRGYGCSGWRSGCPFVIWKQIAGKTLTSSMVKDLIQKGRTRKLTGFTNKEGQKFEASLVLQNGQVTFDFRNG